jgi:hypothetical protein
MFELNAPQGLRYNSAGKGVHRVQPFSGAIFGQSHSIRKNPGTRRQK